MECLLQCRGAFSARPETQPKKLAAKKRDPHVPQAISLLLDQFKDQRAEEVSKCSASLVLVSAQDEFIKGQNQPLTSTESQLWVVSHC